MATVGHRDELTDFLHWGTYRAAYTHARTAWFWNKLSDGSGRAEPDIKK